MIGAKAVVAYNTWGYIMSEQTKTATRTTDDAKSLKLLLGSVITRQPVKFETIKDRKVMVFEESYKDTTTKWLIEETFFTSFADLEEKAVTIAMSLKGQGRINGKQLAKVALKKVPRATGKNGKPFGQCFLVVKEGQTKAFLQGFSLNRSGNYVPVIAVPSNWKGEVDISVASGYYISLYVGAMKK